VYIQGLAQYTDQELKKVHTIQTMAKTMAEASLLRAEAPAFTPTGFVQPMTADQLVAARNHAAQMAQIKAFSLHPLLQQAMLLQNEIQQTKQHSQQKLKKKTKSKSKNLKNFETEPIVMSQSLPSTEDGSKAKPYKRVLAINLPADLQTIDAVTAVFHPYGDVTLVRVLKPGKQLPFDTKQYASKIPELGTVPCALVDFETARAAKFAVHVLRQRAEEVGFRLALLKPGIEEKLYIDDIPKISRSKQVDDIEDQRDQVDSGVTSETSDDSDKRSRISSSDGDVDSDLNNSRASISSEDEHKNDKLMEEQYVKINDGKRHSVTTSDTDHSIDLEPKIQERKSRKTENRVVSSVTIFLKPSKCQTQKKKYFSREELLKLQYPTPDLKNPFKHKEEIEKAEAEAKAAAKAAKEAKAAAAKAAEEAEEKRLKAAAESKRRKEEERLKKIEREAAEAAAKAKADKAAKAAAEEAARKEEEAAEAAEE
jgi:hypothetical protein